jgi:hypothetical protein
LIDGVHEKLPHSQSTSVEPKLENEKEAGTTDLTSDGKKVSSDVPAIEAKAEKPKTYWQRIQLITLAPNVIGTGFKQYFARLFHTCRIFLFPAVIYSGIQWYVHSLSHFFFHKTSTDTLTGAPKTPG